MVFQSLERTTFVLDICHRYLNSHKTKNHGNLGENFIWLPLKSREKTKSSPSLSWCHRELTIPLDAAIDT
jgi:hypothetical protein